VEVILSIITPFAAYVPADALGGSGVLPAVVAGLSLSSYVATGAPSATRLQSRPLWDVIAFVLNNLIFLLTGLQLRSVLGGVQQLSLPHLVAGGAVISVVVVIVRFAWVFSAVYIPRALRRRLRDPPPPWQHAFFIAWTGMRGGISLVVALGIPLIGAAGAPFPQRGLIIFVTSFVIFVTLVLQGLSLPVVIRWLNLTSDDTGAPATLRAQEYDARCRTAEAALAKLDRLVRQDDLPPESGTLVRHLYADRLNGLRPPLGHDGAGRPELARQSDLLLKLLSIERHHLIRMGETGEISDEVFRRISRELDVEELAVRSHMFLGGDEA